MTPDVFIGIDHFFEFNVRKTEIEVNGIFVFETLFGPLACGTNSSPNKRTTVATASALTFADELQTFDQMITPHLKLEHAGFSEESVESTTESYTKFSDHLYYYDNRFQVSLLWNEKSSLLPTNFKLARGRLKSLLRKFKKNPQLFKLYIQTLQEQLKLGIIGRIDDPSHSSGIIDYLPHQAVFKIFNGKPKLRIVYDGGEKYLIGGIPQPSLNEALDKGPLLLNTLTGVLMKIRRFTIVVLADIGKAFLQLSLDRDA